MIFLFHKIFLSVIRLSSVKVNVAPGIHRQVVIEVDLKYVTPVQEQRLFDGVPLYRKRPEHGEILEKLKKGIALSLEEGPFYELRLRSLFSDLWETIYTWAMDERMNQGVYDPREDVFDHSRKGDRA